MSFPFFRQALKRGETLENEWQALYADYQKKHSDLAEEWETMHKAPDTQNFMAHYPILMLTRETSPHEKHPGRCWRQ